MPSSRNQIGPWIRSSLYLILGLFFFLIPGIRLVFDLNDPALRSGEIPHAAWRLHHDLASSYARWANAHMESRRATKVESDDVSGTEWPLFGSVFYLWSMESLQKAWEANPRADSIAPAIYARKAIEAAANLVTDPNHATWVRQKWGDGYLHRQNLFYRFLIISAMTSYTHLTGDLRFIDQLRDQVETLSAEIDASPYGLIEDYPGECYPTDVIGAISAIRRADTVLKTDHSAFIQRALRAFQFPQAGEHDLPGYFAQARSGEPSSISRGCGDSFAFTVAPEIWPDTARQWYQDYSDYFWQEKWGLVGFREFSRETPEAESFMDVDSGPVILGFGFAASAFGTGAARVNGRMDQAAPLTAEMLVSSWPLANGTLLIPRLLSNAVDAPYLGEASILFCLTRQPIAGIEKPAASVMTPFVWALLVLYWALGLLFAWPFIALVRQAIRFRTREPKRN